MKATIYLPDELGERVKAADMNVSAICQAALLQELDNPDVWPEELGSILRTIASEVARVADYTEHLAYHQQVAAEYRRGAWEQAEQESLLREASRAEPTHYYLDGPADDHESGHF